MRPTISVAGLEKARLKELGRWMRNLALNGQIEDERIAAIAFGPVTRRVQCYNMYDVRGFRFHTESYGRNRKTSNYGVCVQGDTGDDTVKDYFGIIEEIMRVEYKGADNEVFLFKCRWFDISRGMRVDKKHGLVEINNKRLLKKDEHFVFAFQAIQVYYMPYASSKRERQDWWVTVKTKGKSRPLILFDGDTFFQEDGTPTEFEVRAEDGLNQPSLFVDGADPEEVTVEDLSNEPKSKKRSRGKRQMRN